MKPSIHAANALACCSIVLWPGVPAHADDATAAQADAPADERHPTMVVIGITPLQGSTLDRSLIAAPVQTATAEDIERSHAADLTAFMNRTLSGVYVNDIQNNPLQPDVNYRGYTASPLLGTPQGLSIYLDGVRLNQPFGDVVSWDLIPRAAISTMEVMPGSNPLFGLNTLGGALSVRTKDGFSDPGSGVQLSYGSNSRRSIELETGGNTASGVYWYATANKLKEDGWRDASPTDALQVFGKLGWRSDHSNIALTAAYADTDLTGNGLQEQRFLARDYDSVYTKPDNTGNRSTFVNLQATHDFSSSISLSGNAYYRNIKTQTLNGDINDDSLGENVYQPTAEEQEALTEAGYTGFPTSGENADNTPFPSWRCIANILLNSEPNENCNGLLNRTRTSQEDGGISGQVTFTSQLNGADNKLTVGAAYIHSRSHFLQSSQFGFLMPDRGVGMADGPGAFADGTQDSEDADDSRVDLRGSADTTSVYATDTMPLGNGLHLTLSARYDRTKIENRDALIPAGEAGSLSGNHTFDRINPALGLTFNPSQAFSAYLGYNEGSRAPSAIELGCADPENPCRLPNSMAGDPPLEQVVTKTYEAGVRGLIGTGLVWNAGVFRSTNDDDIIFVSDEQASFGYFKNFGQTRRQGVELGAKSRIGAFTVGANYTHLDATYRTAESVLGEGNSSNDADAPGFEGNIEIEPGDRIPLIPHYILKSFVQWDVADGFSLDLDAITLGNSYARGNENNQHEPDGVYYLGPGRTAGFTVVNLGADYRPSDHWKLFAEVSNLFDRKYYSAAQLGATGFTDTGNFVSRPFAAPVIDGERPLVGATFYAPGAPRAYWAGVRYQFGK
ncbi:MAG TPA: TonB-dependent receptor [Steroidobacteraceae bacterium]